ncbi:GIP, partial [Symbiodinium sp. CCMP2456]
MIYDVSVGCADFTQVGLKGYKLLSTTSGRPAIPIVPAKPAGGMQAVLSVEDVSLEPRAQYTVHAVAFAGRSSQPYYNLYYEKKLPLETKNMLTQNPLCRESFMSWWKQCEVGGDFWVETEVDLPISKMTKPQLLSECVRLGLTVHRSWSPEEIKAVIMEDRENRKQSDATEKMKRLSQLTLDELKQKAMELNVEFPSRVTKGNLLRLVRDSLNTPDNKLMKIGKYRGMEFREVPWQYGQRASNEVKSSTNADPDLVRFARWWDANEEKKRGYTKGDSDEMSRRPMPAASDPGTTTSWETVSQHVWETSCPTRPALDSRSSAQMPITPPGTGTTANTKRRTKDENPSGMDDEIDEETTEEIKKLELRLALLKDKVHLEADDVIVDTDLAPAHRNQHDVLNVSPGPRADDRPDLVPGEQLAKAMYDKGDFSYKTLQDVLESADLKPRRNDRGEALQTDKQSEKTHSYFTFGMFTHGGVQGVTKLTLERPHLCRYLNQFGNEKIGKGGTWTSLTVSKNVNAGVHRDHNNLKGTANHTCSFGQTAGGNVWLEDRDVQEGDTKMTGLVWRRGAGGAWLPGRFMNTFERILTFDPHYNHATCDWEGERWSMTYHTTRGVLKAGKECCNALKRVGFPLPNLRGVQGSPSTKRPRKSARNAIANTAGKLSVMMTTLLLAVGSYMNDYLPSVQHDPAAMFEIGGIDATYEDAYHFVYGITPKELRVNLDGMPPERRDDILELVKVQVDGGGDVVLRGSETNFFLNEMAGYLEGQRQFKQSCRPHQVFVVGGEDGDAQRREDLVRHLRLAGCEDAIIKAAKGMKCEVCAATAGPRIARPSTVPRMYDFNDCVGADLLHHHDIDDERHTFLSIVDWGTSYHVVVPLEGLDNEDIEKAFNDHWVVPFGPQRTVSLDLDGAVQKGICRLCDWHNVGVKNVAAQAHWQAGITERQGAWWKNIWDRVRHELTITREEVHLAASLVSSAKNELRRRCGHSPTERVFGRHPRLPEGLADPDGGERVTWDVTPESQYQRAAAIRTAARMAFHHSQGDSRLRKALLQRARTTTRPLEVGETVHFRDQPKNRRRGRWTGPAVIVDGDPLDQLLQIQPPFVGTRSQAEDILDHLHQLVAAGKKRTPNVSRAGLPRIIITKPAGESLKVRVGMSRYDQPRFAFPSIRLASISLFTRLLSSMLRASSASKDKCSFHCVSSACLNCERALAGISDHFSSFSWRFSTPRLVNSFLMKRASFTFSVSIGMSSGLVLRFSLRGGMIISDGQVIRKGHFLVLSGQVFVADLLCVEEFADLLGKVVNGKMEGPPVGYVGSHVDDLLVIASTTIGDAIKAELSKTFPVDTWEDDEFAYLGSEIICKDETVVFRQKPYIENRLFVVDIPSNVNEQDLVERPRPHRRQPEFGGSAELGLGPIPAGLDMLSVDGTATDHRDQGLTFRKVNDEEAVILIYHDAAWANAYEGEFDEEGFELYDEDKASGLQHDGPPSHREGRKAKRGNSRVASQLGELIVITEKSAIAGGSHWCSILDWKSRAGQRVCRSTFSAETQACVEGLEGGQYVRAVYEALTFGELKKVEDATLPVVCLSDCRSLYDHLHREGVPRTPSDRRLAIDLAALRQALRLERWTERLPLAWIPSELQLGDVLTKPQDPKAWWNMILQKLTIPISIIETGGRANKSFREREKTSVKPCGNYRIDSGRHRRRLVRRQKEFCAR